MLTHISTLEDLEKEALEIDSFLNITISDDMNECVERGTDLLVYMTRTGKMLADAKYWLNKAKSGLIVDNFRKNSTMAPSVMVKLIDSALIQENYMVDWIERLNRSCVHQLDFIRTMISKTKEEMKYQNFNK